LVIGGKMKKFTLLILLLIATLLSGCDPSTYYFSKIDYIDEIERIELIKYTNENYKMVDSTKYVLKFDSSKVENIEILDKDKFSDFLCEFEEIVFHIENDSVDEPTGYCLLWYLKNGNFIVFSCTMIEGDRAYSMVSEFDSTNNFIKHYGYFAARPHYENVLEKYFKNYVKE
jgi:hypothetical protein